MEELPTPPPGERSTKGVVKKFRASEEEVKKIETKAGLAGLNFSEYVRRAALDKELIEAMPRDLRQAILGISTNLNQLTRLANAGRLPGISGEELKAIADELIKYLWR